MALVPDEAITRMAEVSGAAFKMYAYLCRRRNHATGDCFPNLKTIARETGLNYAYASQIRSELVRAGWLVISNGTLYPACGFTLPKGLEIPKQNMEIPKVKVLENPNISLENPKAVLDNPNLHIKELTSPFNQPIKPAKGRRTTKRGSRLPSGFHPTPEMREWAAIKHPDVDVETQTEMFINYYTAATGEKAIKRDWPATWRNWIIRSTTYTGRDNQNGKNQTGRATNRQRLNEYAELFAKYENHDNAG